MTRIIAGATGLIGKRLVEHWLSQGHAIIVIGRSAEKIKNTFQDRVRAITWDQLTLDSLRGAEVVVNLTGAGVADKRWSAARKQEIIDSRVIATQKIAGLLAELGRDSPPLLNASAIGIYGLQPEYMDDLHYRFDESRPIDWENAPDFLSSVGRKWEKAAQAAVAKNVRVVFMRFGVVLAKEGGALPQLVKPFHFYMGGIIGSGGQPFSWVMLEDVLRAIDFLLEKPTITGPVNIVAPNCVTQRELAETIGKILNKPVKMKIPDFILKMMLGEMAQELIYQGQHVYPQRLLDAGFHFVYPNIEVALRQALV